MSLVLSLHPTPISEDELVGELSSKSAPVDRATVDALLQGLEASGLIHRSQGLLWPTIAAVRLDQLFTE
jgi:Fe2+ or Zn2+ uptake regulation protein